MEYSHSPLLQAISRHAVKQPEKTAIVVSGTEWTYSTLFENILRTASYLNDLGLVKGDRIILTATKDIEFVFLYYASHVLGIINVIVDGSTNESRLRFIESKVSPKFCFGYQSPQYSSYDFSDFSVSSYELFHSETSIARTDIAEILFTTGTTGNPKGVCLSYWNIFSSADNINAFICNKDSDVELLALPICHSFGLGRLRCTLLMGGTIVLLGSFANVRLFLGSIEKYHISGFGVVPAAWAYIRKISGRRVERYASQIRYIEIGSAAMPLESKKEMLEMFPETRICMHYGLTEASRSTFIEFHDTEHLTSIGKPVSPQVDVKIFDGHGNQLPIGETGEICVKGNMVMNRYLDDDHTWLAFYDGYFRTGDCGYISDDGYCYLVGREKELINVGGKKVSPMEVEDAICSLGVGDCVCVGVGDGNGLLGEVVKAYILKGSTTLEFEEIAQRLSALLEPYKRPVVYEWIDEIPVTQSGKKQRVKLKEVKA